MRKAKVFIHGMDAGVLEEQGAGNYVFSYHEDYKHIPISLSMPVKQRVYPFEKFPPIFEGLLPEGPMLDGLLDQYQLDKKDLLGQLLQVGKDLVGAITVEPII